MSCYGGDPRKPGERMKDGERGSERFAREVCVMDIGENGRLTLLLVDTPTQGYSSRSEDVGIEQA